jgi:hypothetical protein
LREFTVPEGGGRKFRRKYEAIMTLNSPALKEDKKTQN